MQLDNPTNPIQHQSLLRRESYYILQIPSSNSPLTLSLIYCLHYSKVTSDLRTCYLSLLIWVTLYIVYNTPLIDCLIDCLNSRIK